MDFSFVQISDHHLLASDNALHRGFSTAWAFRQVMAHIADTYANDIDFIISTGDLAQNGSEDEYAFVSEMLSMEKESPAPGPQRISFEGLQRVPMYFLPGNHDSRYNFYRQLFPASRPAELVNAKFEYQGIRFICIDWGPTTNANLNQQLLDFLSEALQQDQPAIIMMHHQVVPLGHALLDGFIAEDMDKFWNILAGHNILGIFSGHVHTNYETHARGIPVFGTGATSFQFAIEDDELLMYLKPIPYRLVTLQNGELSTMIVEVPI